MFQALRFLLCNVANTIPIIRKEMENQLGKIHRHGKFSGPHFFVRLLLACFVTRKAVQSTFGQTCMTAINNSDLDTNRNRTESGTLCALRDNFLRNHGIGAYCCLKLSCIRLSAAFSRLAAHTVSERRTRDIDFNTIVKLPCDNKEVKVRPCHSSQPLQDTLMTTNASGAQKEAYPSLVSCTVQPLLGDTACSSQTTAL